MSLGNLYVSIRASVDDMVGDLKAIQKELDETTKYVKPLKEAILGMGEAMSAVGDVIVGGLFEITKKTAEVGAEMERLHERTGIAVGDLSVLRVAATQSGIGFDDLQTSLKKFGPAVEAAASGSQKQSDVFKQLGVNIRDTNGAIRPMADIFADVATKTSQFSDGVVKASDMTVLFGKNGQALIPMLNDLGKEGFDAVRQKTEAFGLNFEKVAEQSELFHRSMDALKSSTEGLGATIGEQLMPLFTEIIQDVTAVVQAVRQWVAVHPEITEGVLALAAAIGGTGGLLLATAGVIAIMPTLTLAFTALTGPIGIAILSVTAFSSAMMLFPSFRGTVVTVLNQIIDAVVLVGSYFGSVGKAIEQAISGQFRAAYDTMAQSLVKSMDAMQGADDAFHTFQGTLQTAVVTIPKATAATNDLTVANTHLAEQMSKAMDAAYKSAYKNSQETIKQMETDADDAIKYWSKVYEAVLNAQIAGEKASQKAYDEVVKDAEERMKYLSDIEKKALDDEAKTADERAKEIQKQNEANAEYIKKTNQQVADAAGHIFDDMFVKGQSVFSSLQNALKGGLLSIGRTIFDDIVGYLGGPIKRAFDDFFTGLLEGSGLKNFLSGLGNKIGGALSGIFGGGSSDPNFVGPTQGGGGMSGLLKGGLITAGIGAAIAAGEALWNHFTQLGKDKSTFVSQYQNPFGQNLEDIVNQFNAARATGQLTVSDATTTLNSVKTLIANFESNISDWTKKGGDYATVAQRAQATMDADFGANFSDLLASMQTNIDQRQGVIDDAVTAQNAATDAQNAQNQATADAAAATTSATDSMNNFTSSVIKWGDQLGQITKAADQAQKITAASGHPTTGAISSAVTTAQAAADVANTATKAVTTTVNGILTASGVYMSANQLADLANSGGSYTASSGYNSLIPGAGLSSVTGTYFSPGSIANMTQDQLAALGIPSYGSGTPMVKQRHLAVLDPGEAVLTASQNRSGGGNTYNIYSYSMDPDGAARSIRTVIDTIEANPGGQKDRLKRVLGVR